MSSATRAGRQYRRVVVLDVDVEDVDDVDDVDDEGAPSSASRLFATRVAEVASLSSSASVPFSNSESILRSSPRMSSSSTGSGRGTTRCTMRGKRATCVEVLDTSASMARTKKCLMCGTARNIPAAKLRNVLPLDA